MKGNRNVFIQTMQEEAHREGAAPQILALSKR